MASCVLPRISNPRYAQTQHPTQISTAPLKSASGRSHAVQQLPLARGARNMACFKAGWRYTPRLSGFDTVSIRTSFERIYCLHLHDGHWGSWVPKCTASIITIGNCTYSLCAIITIAVRGTFFAMRIFVHFPTVPSCCLSFIPVFLHSISTTHLPLLSHC